MRGSYNVGDHTKGSLKLGGSLTIVNSQVLGPPLCPAPVVFFAKAKRSCSAMAIRCGALALGSVPPPYFVGFSTGSWCSSTAEG